MLTFEKFNCTITDIVINRTVNDLPEHHFCSMNFIKNYWEKFKAKSLLGKLSDIFFLLFFVAILTSDGRIFIQKMILNTGLFSGVDTGEAQALNQDEKQWTWTNQNGEYVRLDDLNGKPVFINFWATWCPPCNAEMPGIIELMDEVGEKASFVFLTTESPELVSAFLAKKGWNIPVYYYDYVPSESLNSEALPTTVIINSKGEIIHKSKGMRKWNTEDAKELLLNN